MGKNITALSLSAASEFLSGIIITIVAVLLSAGVASQELQNTPFPTSPQVVVEIGAHTDTTRRVGADASGEFVVSGSTDKTVRIWKADDGGLLRTIRLPRSGDEVGRVYSVALSPDARVVAVGGFTVPDGHPEQIYLFDRESGALVRHIEGLPHRVADLAFSPDGQSLAAATKAPIGGLRVYRLSDGVEIAADDYGADSYSVDFSKDGRLVTTSWDGSLRLYDRSFHRTAEVPISAPHPHSAPFSPDGQEIAVASSGTGGIDILAANDLRLLYHVDTADVREVTAIAWSASGWNLCADGPRLESGDYSVSCWSEHGRGKRRDFAVGADSVFDLVTISTGGFAFGSYGSAVGVLNPNDSVRWSRFGKVADFRGQRGDNSIRVSADGSSVVFGFEEFGRRPARLDLRSGTLIFDPSPDANLVGAEISARGFSIEDWANSSTPILDGTRVRLETENEISRSLSIMPKGKGFILGTDWYIRSYNSRGKLLWKTATGSYAWSVTITGDGKTVVAGLGDGTLRWYDVASGSPLLTAFVEASGRWVAWLPEGFFASSEGGAELIGYQLNRGRDEAPEFVRFNQLFERFYRSELVIARLMRDETAIDAAAANGGSIDQLISAARPPVLSLMGPTSQIIDGPDFTLQVEVEDRGGGVGPLEVRVNGILLDSLSTRAEPANIGGGKVTQKRPLRLVPGRNVIESRGTTSDGSVASPVIRQVVFVREDATSPPALRGLAIGIDKYYDSALTLRYAAGDAAAIQRNLEERSQSLFSLVDINLLTDEQATKSGIKQAFAEMAHLVQPQDVFVLYLAGHGLADDGHYYFVPQDVRFTNQESLRAGSLSERELVDLLKMINAQKSLIVLDTCYAGAFAAPQQLALLSSRGPAEKAAIDRLMRATGRAVIAATTTQQVAIEGYQGHGVFSYGLLEGLSGSADSQSGDRNGFISILELGAYLDRRVPELSESAFKVRQIPMHYFSNQDFDIGRIP